MKNQCTSFVNDWMYSGKLPDRIDRTNTSMVSCSCRTRNQNNEHWLAFLLKCAPVFQTHGFGVGFGCFHMFLVCLFHASCKTQAVTWWARLVRVMCAAFRNESAFPNVGTHACTTAPVQPLLSRRFSTVSKAADSKCIRPNVMTHFDSP